MQHELGWDVVNCYDDPTSLTILRRGFERHELRRTGRSSGVSNQGRDGKREEGNIEHRTPNIEHRSEEKRKIRLNPDLPVDHSSPRLRMAEAIEGAVDEREILNGEFWILNGRGGRQVVPRLNPALSLVERLICPPAKFWDHLHEPAP